MPFDAVMFAIKIVISLVSYCCSISTHCVAVTFFVAVVLFMDYSSRSEYTSVENQEIQTTNRGRLIKVRVLNNCIHITRKLQRSYSANSKDLTTICPR